MAPPLAPDEAAARRRALGEFLRSRRERLAPEGRAAGRRRTPGLRREEVAERAGISTAWYTSLEQGRDVRPSPAALRAVADALRLDAAERGHLFALAGPPGAAPPGDAPLDDAVPAALRRLLDGIGARPAYVLNPAWDVVAWNAPAAALFTDFGALPPEERNIVRYVFTDAALRGMYVNWAENARQLVAQFRAGAAGGPDEARVARLARDLAALSPEFAAWWGDHDVDAPVSGVKALRHPAAGELSLEYATFRSNDNPRLTLVTYMPVGAEDARRLERLAGRATVAG